ncbi:hypothetical protein T484DRAFT_1890772, partial [Baffinella frigidus]
MLPALGRSHAHRISPSLAGRSNYKAGRPNYSGFLEDEWEGRGPSQTRSKSTPLVRRPKETGWNLPTSARMDAELAEEELYFRGGGERGGGEKYAPYRGGGGGGGRPAVDAFPQGSERRTKPKAEGDSRRKIKVSEYDKALFSQGVLDTMPQLGKNAVRKRGEKTRVQGWEEDRPEKQQLRRRQENVGGTIE